MEKGIGEELCKEVLKELASEAGKEEEILYALYTGMEKRTSDRRQKIEMTVT
jgi:hypothetical protein